MQILLTGATFGGTNDSTSFFVILPSGPVPGEETRETQEDFKQHPIGEEVKMTILTALLSTDIGCRALIFVLNTSPAQWEGRDT